MNNLTQFEAEILNLIEDREDMTFSDLQGAVNVLVKRIYQAGANTTDHGAN